MKTTEKSKPKETPLDNRIESPKPIELNSLFDENECGFILPDEWFTDPQRIANENRLDFVLPINSKKVLDNIGTNKNKARLKFAVLEKNATNHKELSADDSRLILDAVLNLSDNGKIIMNKGDKPFYRLLIHVEDLSATARIDLRGIGNEVEIIGWHWMRATDRDSNLKKAIKEKQN